MTSLFNANILNEGILLTNCIVSTALTTLVLTKQNRQWFRTRLPLHVGGSLAVGAVVLFVLQRSFELDHIPWDVILWIGLIVCTISIIFTIHRSRKLRVIAIIGAVSSLFFAANMANQYYQYFPTLGSLFNQSSVVKYDHTTQRANFTALSQLEESTYVPPNTQPLQGRLDSVTIPGDQSHFQARQGYVYLPPAALNGDQSPKLPVAVLLAGVPGSPDDWKVRINLTEVLDAFAGQHHGLAPIVVIADQAGGDGFQNTGCVDSPRGNVETYLTQDLPAFVKSHYNVETDSKNWAVGGFSDGATCSIVLGTRHPDIYQTLMSLSGEAVPTAGSQQRTLALFFHDSKKEYEAHDARLILQSTEGKQKLAHSAIWLAAGKDEESALVQANRDMYNEAKNAGIDVTFELLTGHHSFGLWKNGFIDALPWLSYHVGLTDCERACK